jgi:hypothetical protein
MSAEVSCICPHCNGEMNFASEHRGMKSQCPHCQKEIILGRIGVSNIKNKTLKNMGVFLRSFYVLGLLLLFVAPIVVLIWNCKSYDVSLGEVLSAATSNASTTTETVQGNPRGLRTLLENSLIVIVFLPLLWIVFAKELKIGQKVVVFFVYLFTVFIIASRFSGSGSASNPNQGYMTKADEETYENTLIKQGHGESLTESEQEYLDAVKAGKFGKPYDDRPDKDKDGVE